MRYLGAIILSMVGFAGIVAAGTAEEDEARRIQIGETNVSSLERFPIYPAAKEQPIIIPWYGCKAEIVKDGICVSSAADVRPWAGFRLKIPKTVNPLVFSNLKQMESLSLSFKLKALGNGDLKQLQVCIEGTISEGKSGQSGWKPLSGIAKDATGWSEITLPLQDFLRIEQLKSIDGIGVQFIDKGPGTTFLLDTIQFQRKISKTSQVSFKIEDTNLAGQVLTTEKFPDRATNIRISGANIVRNGKPVFLTGVEDDAINFPWLYRLLGFDIIQLQDFTPNNQAQWRLNDKQIEVTWTPMKDWIDTKIRYLLHQGLAIHINYWDDFSSQPAFNEFFADAVADTSHFYKVRLDHPLGREFKEKYYKACLKTLGKYPITFYELYNEIYYGDASPMAIAAFQQAMKNKYGAIANANKAWSTSFRSFDLLTPPKKKARWMVTRNEIAPSDVSPELYAEWQEFLEKWLGLQLRQLSAAVKKNIKYPGSYLVYQATMGLHEDFSGFTGTHPHELLSAEDALCHEGGMNFCPQEKGSESSSEIAAMTRPLMIWDLLKSISPDKPVYLSECTVRTYAPAFDQKSTVVNLSGTWRFIDDSKAQGVAAGLQKPELGENNWNTKINMPGIWGSQGFPRCTRGWLRKSFDLPQGHAGRLFLTGRELADCAKIYVNGKLVHETAQWNDCFSTDITALLKPQNNVLTLCIDNKYEVSGQIQGGIRDFIAITDRQFFKATKLTAGQMRSWFWSMAVHDVSGVVMSYFYTPATNADVGSLYSPEHCEYEAIRAIPDVKREIDSVAETLLPRPRLQGKVAFVYPFETGRANIPRNTTEMFTGKITRSMMEYYMSALFSQITPEVISCREINGNSADRYRAIVLSASPRVPGDVPELLERFVSNGGVLILDANAMSIDNDRHRPIPTPAWFGIKISGSRNDAGVISSPRHGLDRVAAEPRLFDQNCGVNITSAGAEVLARFDDGSPAITVNRHGKGKVYYFAGKLPFIELKKVMAAILKDNGIMPQTRIESRDGSPANYVESHIIGTPNRYIWYVNNFGGGERKLKIAWPTAPEGEFTLSDIKTCKVLNKNLDAQKLRQGIEITAAGQDPVTLLLERNGMVTPLALKPLPTAQQRFLAMWRPSPKSTTKILFNSCARDEIDPFRMLTGKKLLEDAGFEIGYAKTLPQKGLIKTYFDRTETQPLTNFKIYVLPGTRATTQENAECIAEYVRNGGSVFITATANFGYFNWMSNWHRRNLFAAFGIKGTDNNFQDGQNYTFTPYFCSFANIKSGHPITAGVKKIQLAGASEIQPTAADQEVLIRSNPSSKPANAPFLIAYEFGKGRVVVAGDAQWLEPEWLSQADNAQLMLNIFNWLAHRETKEISAQQRQAINNNF